MAKLTSGSLIEVEKELEANAVRAGADRYKRLVADARKRGMAAALNSGQRLLRNWFVSVKASISSEKANCTKNTPGKSRRLYGKVIHALDTDRMTVIAMHVPLSMWFQEDVPPTTLRVSYAIGRAINAQLNKDIIFKERGIAWKRLNKRSRAANPRQVQAIARIYHPIEVWEKRRIIALGACLLNIVIRRALTGRGAKKHHAFESKVVWEKHRCVARVFLAPETAEIVRAEHEYRELRYPRYQPMVVRPLMWTQEERGGYYSHQLTLTKLYQHGKKDFARMPAPVLESMNAINRTPWRINKDILAVVNQLWDEGGGVAGIPRRSDLPFPPKAADFQTNKEAKRAWKAEAKMVYRDNIHLRAERFNFSARVSVAERTKRYQKIYFPHQFDFTGRAYPVPLYLNHHGEDVCRGLLEFANPCTTVENDDHWRWWRIHFANVCGIDKVSFQQREQWAMDNTDAQKWAKDPLEHTGWMEQDKPFQALAAAFALSRPENRAHLPVSVDGSSNAVQHYAAMLRDPEAAERVNLLPCDAPMDFYTDVLKDTLLQIASDAGNGNAVAALLEGQVTRKVIKQTAMTTVYDVTHVGARRQIYARLEDIGFDKANLWAASKYLSKVVLKATSDVATSSSGAMEWLKKCARIIAKTNRTVAWTTPFGLKVRQPYRRQLHYIKTLLHQFHYRTSGAKDPVILYRQVSAMAPNYVHSVDAAHMMAVANQCHRDDIAFAAVHDAYLTHADTMERLSQILRTEFVAMHETPLLECLHKEFCESYPGLDFPEPPPIGTLDIRRVLDSSYAFS